MKVVINKCYGVFGLSVDAMLRYAELKGFELYPFVDKRPTDFKNQLFEPYDKNHAKEYMSF